MHFLAMNFGYFMLAFFGCGITATLCHIYNMANMVKSDSESLSLFWPLVPVAVFGFGATVCFWLSAIGVVANLFGK